MPLTAKVCDGLRYKSPTEQATIRERETTRAKVAGEQPNQNLWANSLTDDGEHRGLRLTVNQDGSKTWVYRYNDLAGGPKKQIKLGSYPGVTLSEARQRLREKRKLREVGADPREQLAKSRAALVEAAQAKRKKDYTVADLCDAYCDHLKANRRKPDEPVRMVQKEIKAADIAKTVLSELRMHEVQNLHDAIVARVRADSHPASRGGGRLASMVITELRAAIEFARRKGTFPEDKRNPCDGVKRMGTGPSTARDRYLDEGELGEFFDWLPTAKLSRTVRDVLLLELLTTARQGEIVQMMWSQLDLDRGVWRQTNEITKNKRRHRFYLSDPAVQLLKNRRDELPATEHVFFNPFHRPLKDGETRPARSPRNRPHISSKQVGTSLWRVRKELSFHEDFTTHDLRRTALTMLGKLGCPRLIQDKISNHFDGSIGGRYDRADYSAECKQWLSRLAEHYIGLGLKVAPVPTL